MPQPDPLAPPSTSPPPRRAVLAGLAAVTLLALVVYANALANGYAIDDEPILLRNATVHGLGNLRGVLLGPYWPSSHALYRPVTLFTLAAQWAIHGNAPAAFHAVNVLLHAAATALVFLLVLRLGGGVWAAALGGAVFAVHPLHVEAVANVIGRAEILSALFYLGACHLYLGAARAGPGRMAGIAALYFLAMGSKEIAVTLPGALLLLDALRSWKAGTRIAEIARRNAVLVAVLVATLIGYLLLRRSVLGATLGDAPAAYIRGTGMVERWALAARLWPEYLRLIFWPADLSAEWGPNTLMVPTWRDPAVWASLALVVALAALAAWAWNRQRWVSVAVLWLAATVFPVSQIAFPIGVMMAERTLYLPSAALVFLAPPLVAALAREAASTRRAVAAVGVLLLGLAAARTWTRTPTWKDSSAAFDALVDEHPEVWRVDWKAAELLFAAGRGDEGLPYFERALEKTHYGHAVMVEEYTRWMLRAAEPRRAEKALRRVLEYAPEAPAGNLYLARALFDEGRYREAAAAANTARTASPEGRQVWAGALHVAALAHDALGERAIAAAQSDSALADAQWRALPMGWFHRARLRALAGDTAGARAALGEARKHMGPGYAEALTLTPVPPPTHPAMRGWVFWRPDGTVGGVRNIRPREFDQ
ncbi:MAG TPA: tetratricopeptide repeat protein [Longimicrobium sp.]|nr:tetratricopeptide repeat protein [Longimicrobium sp.]